MTLHVRRYEPADAPRCCDVINDAIRNMDGLNEAARDRVRASNVPERLGKDLEGWLAMVVESDDGRIVGLGALDDDEVKRVYVDPAAQGQGAATALMSALEAVAADHAVITVQLDASPSSVEFYESLGYLRGNEADLELENAVFRFVHMTKRLALDS